MKKRKIRTIEEYRKSLSKATTTANKMNNHQDTKQSTFIGKIFYQRNNKDPRYFRTIRISHNPFRTRWFHKQLTLQENHQTISQNFTTLITTTFEYESHLEWNHLKKKQTEDEIKKVSEEELKLAKKKLRLYEKYKSFIDTAVPIRPTVGRNLHFPFHLNYEHFLVAGVPIASDFMPWNNRHADIKNTWEPETHRGNQMRGQYRIHFSKILQIFRSRGWLIPSSNRTDCPNTGFTPARMSNIALHQNALCDWINCLTRGTPEGDLSVPVMLIRI